MAAIHGSNTKPEMIVRRYLWSRGFRYRINDKRLPGRPDIVLKKYRACIFINGCFWHGHRMDDGTSCRYYTVPKTNTTFWLQKVARNQQRDEECRRKLAEMGWHTIVVWECQLKPKVRQDTLQELVTGLSHLYLYDRRPKPYILPDEPLTLAAEPDEG